MVTLQPYAIYSGAPQNIFVLVSLLVCLIPTTIGGLLSAIGIAGMDRMIQRNVIAMSGRAVEASGDVDVLLLDKTGTITLGNRQATKFYPSPGVTEAELADAAQLASIADETPEGPLHRRAWRSRNTACAAANWPRYMPEFIPFTAADPNVRREPGRPAKFARARRTPSPNLRPSAAITFRPSRKQIVEEISSAGGTPLLVAKNRVVLGAIQLEGHRQGRHARTL